ALAGRGVFNRFVLMEIVDEKRLRPLSLIEHAVDAKFAIETGDGDALVTTGVRRLALGRGFPRMSRDGQCTENSDCMCLQFSKSFSPGHDAFHNESAHDP